MFGKLIDGNLVIAGNEIKTDKGTVTNPNEELLKSLGYKEIVYTEKPEYDKENEALAEKYTEEENKILVGYDIEVLSAYAHNQIIKQEIVEEESKITTRNILDFMVDNDQEARNRIQIHRNKIIELRAKLVKEPKEEDNGNID